jgi:type IV pilus assembly protein PilO
MAAWRFRLDLSRIRLQFQGLNGRHPGLWPLLPRIVLCGLVFAALVAVGYALHWRDLHDQLQTGQAEELRLKAQYTEKVRQAVNLEALRKQKEQVDQIVSQLEKQLPSKAEMDALLSDINQAGVGRGAQLQLFKPGQVVVRDYYAELPINVRVAGSFNDLGSFASDLANLPRIVTLNNVVITLPDRASLLTMEAVAKTFRYLDTEEIAQQRQAAARRKAAEGARRPGSGASAPAAPAPPSTSPAGGSR